MALPLYTTLALSCNKSEESSGPTIVHSTGVPNYRIQPELIRILQEKFTNEKLCDDEKGVKCSDPAQQVIQTFQKAGFSITTSSTSADRKIWLLTKTGESGEATDNLPDEEEQADVEEEEDVEE